MRHVYLHVPFCRRKCGYCAFYSVEDAPPALYGRYLDKLERDLAAFPFPGEVATLYIGGGTPTLLEPASLRRLLAMVGRHIPLVPDAEVTMEANPETLSREKLELIRPLVTRLSLGLQSFDAEIRRQLGRDCSNEAIAAALELAAELAFPHCSADFIYAAPGETDEVWHETLARAVGIAVLDHLSAYALTPEDHTRLGAAGVTADDEAAARRWEFAGTFLAAHGLPRYEVSNYAKPGGECRHNLGVWRGELLYGFGPAAASWDGALRYRQLPDLAAWLAGAPPEEDPLPPEARRNEIFAVNLRTVAGWRKRDYLALAGATAAEWEARHDQVGKLAAEFPELWTVEPERLALSTAGLLFWDEMAEHFI